MTKRKPLIKQENGRLCQQNLKLKIENKFVKKLSVLVNQQTKNRKPWKYPWQVTQLRRELKVGITFILDTINANPQRPYLYCSYFKEEG